MKETFDLTNSQYLNRKYYEFYSKKGYIPEVFMPYDCAEVRGAVHCITTMCGSPCGSSSMLIIERKQIE